MKRETHEEVFVFSFGCGVVTIALLAPAIVISTIVGGVCAVLWLFGVL